MALLFLLVALALLLVSSWVILRYFKVARGMQDERRDIKSLKQIDNSRVPERTLLELTHNFTEGEDRVFWADRQHWMAYWPSGVMMMFLSGFFVAMTAAMAVHPLAYTVHLHSRRHVSTVHIQLIWLAWLPLLVALLCGLTAWMLWLRWRAVLRVITNRGLLLEFHPWPWAWWLWNDEKQDPQPFRSIISAQPNGTFWGKMLGYGTVEVKTWQMEDKDEPLHRLRFVRGYREFAKILNEQREQAAADSPAETAAVPLRRA